MLQTKLTGEPSIYDSDSIDLEFLDYKNDGVISENKSYTENEVVIVNFEDEFNDYIISEEQLKESVESKGVNNASTSTAKEDWTSYTPADLKSQSSLTTNTVIDGGHVSKKQKGYQDKIPKWVSARASLTHQQQAAFLEHHQLKMEQMREKHALELKMMDEKHKIEIHNLKVTSEILLLQKQKEIKK